ncbi:hypothetical protein J6590_030660 [Homalodisca vitripennis]|nr:hypothetical protein J6590_030660 [Homalodisca vitripennis]
MRQCNAIITVNAPAYLRVQTQPESNNTALDCGSAQRLNVMSHHRTVSRHGPFKYRPPESPGSGIIVRKTGLSMG